MQKKISLERLNVISSCNAYSNRNATEYAIFLQNAIYFIKPMHVDFLPHEELIYISMSMQCVIRFNSSDLHRS